MILDSVNQYTVFEADSVAEMGSHLPSNRTSMYTSGANRPVVNMLNSNSMNEGHPPMGSQPKKSKKKRSSLGIKLTPR